MKKYLLHIKVSTIIFLGLFLIFAPFFNTTSVIIRNNIKQQNNISKTLPKDDASVKSNYQEISNKAGSLFDSSKTKSVIKDSGLSHNQQNLGTIDDNGLYQNNFLFYAKSHDSKTYINHKYAVTTNYEKQYGYGEGATFADYHQISNSSETGSVAINNDDVQISLPTKVKSNEMPTTNKSNFINNDGHRRNYSFDNLTRFNDVNIPNALPFPVVDPSWYNNPNNPTVNYNSWYSQFTDLRKQLYDFISTAKNNTLLTGGIANPITENLNPKSSASPNNFYLSYFNYNFIISDKYDKNGVIETGKRQLYCFIYSSSLTLGNTIQGNYTRGISIFFHLPVDLSTASSNTEENASYYLDKTHPDSNIFSLLTTDSFGILSPIDNQDKNHLYIPRYSNYLLSVIYNINNFKTDNKTYFPREKNNFPDTILFQAPNYLKKSFPIFIYGGASPSWDGSISTNLPKSWHDIPLNSMRFNNPITQNSQLVNNFSLINDPNSIPNQSNDNFGSGWRTEDVLFPGNTGGNIPLLMQSRYLNKVAIGLGGSSSNSKSVSDSLYTNPSVDLGNLPMIVDISEGFLVSDSTQLNLNSEQKNISFSYPLKNPTLTSSNESGNPYIYHESNNDIFIIACAIILSLFFISLICGFVLTYNRKKRKK